MGIIELVLIGASLAMDAFAVSICKGLSMIRMNYKKALVIGIYFGLFQGIMPILGYILGESFKNNISTIDHWASFILLSIIGLNMIKDAISDEEIENNDNINFKVMFPLALATSIDALTIGITFSFLKVNILIAFILISIITFLISFIGVKIGNKFGNKYKNKACLTGGTILILMGLKILLEHLGII